MAACGACRLLFRQYELAADLIGHRNHLCPKCGGDLTAVLRTHLYTCVCVPKDVRARAADAREAAGRLVKESGALADRADVRMREVEAALAAFRETMRKSRPGD